MRDFVRLRAELLAALVAAVRSTVPEALKDDLAIALGELAAARRHARGGALEVQRAEAALAAWSAWITGLSTQDLSKIA